MGKGERDRKKIEPQRGTTLNISREKGGWRNFAAKKWEEGLSCASSSFVNTEE